MLVLTIGSNFIYLIITNYTFFLLIREVFYFENSFRSEEKEWK